MTKKQTKLLIRIGVGAVLLLAAVLLPVTGLWRLPLFLLPYCTVGYDVLWKAARNIVHGQVFDENFLMCVATLGALAIGEYPEAVFVMLFYQVGELFQSVAVGKSRRSIASLMDIRPDTANLLQNGEPVKVSPEDVRVGDVILIQPGEKIPLDGVVIEGASSLSTVALTGESAPRDVAPGDTVLSGCVNMQGVLQVRVQKPFAESTAVKILELVENAGAVKAKSENFITKFARWYTPVVVIAALLLAVVPPLVAGGWSQWIHRALIFLVVSCPCALVISVPLTFFGGIGGASRSGILIKGSQYMETLANVRTVVFDKTGTLTKGVFEVVAVHPHAVSEAQVLALAASAEQFSTHPIALSLRAAGKMLIPAEQVTDVQEVAGRGVAATVRGVPVLVGNEALLRDHGIAGHPCHKTGTIVHVAAGGKYLGHIVISDAVKPHAADAVARLKALGVARTVLLTGDRQAAAQEVAGALGIDELFAELLPGDKVDRVEALLDRQERGTLAFVGDGMNDAPVLARADVGIAMGGMGSDAAIEAADVVLMDDDPARVPQAVAIARHTLAIVRQNIAFALGVKALVLVLAAFGLAPMWLAVFADVGVSVIAILNATRALRVAA